MKIETAQKEAQREWSCVQLVSVASRDKMRNAPDANKDLSFDETILLLSVMSR